MGSDCENCIEQVAAIVERTGRESSDEKEIVQQMVIRIFENDAEIDKLERTIETECLRLLLEQQPVASDLRYISAALKMISDMERIGDQCSDIADITNFFISSNVSDLASFHNISSMADATRKMVQQAVDSFIRRDLDLAKKVQNSDDLVDRLFGEVKEEIAEAIADHPERGESMLDLLMIAKYFERIGDHATNIAEWVEFSITGSHPFKEKYSVAGAPYGKSVIIKDEKSRIV